MHECEAAAVSLGLGDTSVEPDGQTDVSFDPPFCYFEDGFLKYNQGGSNTGRCTPFDNCVCATSNRELVYDNLTAVTTGVELRSTGGVDIAGRLGDIRAELPHSFNVLGLLEDVQRDVEDAFYEFLYCRGGCRRLTSGASGVLWRVDAEVVAYDRYTSEQLFYALSNLLNPMTEEHTSFLDAVQLQAQNSSLLVADLLVSEPVVRRPTETMTETQTTTTRTTVTATATITTAPAAAADRAVPPPVEDSAMPLIVALAGGAAVLLAGGSAAAALASKRRKGVNIGNDVQHTIDWDMERGTASHDSKYSSNVIEI